MDKVKQPATETMRLRPAECLERLPELYREAARENITLSHFLENEDPSHEWENTEDRKIRAFGRVLRASGFRFKSDPAEGIWADSLEKVYEDPVGRALLPEWARSVWRRTLNNGYQPQVRSIFGSGDDLVGGLMRPYTDKPGIAEQLLTPAVRLSDLVAMTTPVDSDTYRSAYLDEPSAPNVRLSRVQEKSDIPRSSITVSEHVIRLFKYGRGIEISYEAGRRIRIDKIAFWLARAALQVEADRVAQAIDVAINGDGNASTAATNYNQSALDTGAVLTVKGYLAFKSKWKQPYRMTHIFARETELTNLQLLQFPNNNPFMFQGDTLAGFGGITPMQDLLSGNVIFGQTDQVPAGVYLGIDARVGLERITEIGSDIQETTRFIERQTEALFFTENDGFGVLDNLAAKTLTMA